MINITIPGKGPLQLPADFTLAITIPSPLYFGGDLSLIPGGYSLPLTINANPDNRQKLGFPDFQNIKNFTKKLTAQLFLDGNYYDTGTLWVKAATPDKYKIQFFLVPATSPACRINI